MFKEAKKFFSVFLVVLFLATVTVETASAHCCDEEHECDYGCDQVWFNSGYRAWYNYGYKAWYNCGSQEWDHYGDHKLNHYGYHKLNHYGDQKWNYGMIKNAKHGSKIRL